MTFSVKWVATLRPDGLIDFFPVGYDTSNLVDVSRVGDRFARYIHRGTGEEVNCLDFSSLVQEQLK